MIHAHFEDGYLRIVRQAENGEWEADVVIEVADGFSDPITDAQQSGNDVFGAGFAGAASNGDNGFRPMAAGPMRKTL
jgi:hypothetical protein